MILSKKRRTENPLVAMFLDRAVVYFGESLRNDLEAVNENTKGKSDMKRERITQSYLRRPDLPSSQAAPKFRDPADRMNGLKSA